MVFKWMLHLFTSLEILIGFLVHGVHVRHLNNFEELGKFPGEVFP